MEIESLMFKVHVISDSEGWTRDFKSRVGEMVLSSLLQAYRRGEEGIILKIDYKKMEDEDDE